MRSVFALVALPLLLLFILDGSLPPLLPAISVQAFPAAVTSSLASTTAYNTTAAKSIQTGDIAVVTTGDVTEYPVFISVTEETQPSPETVESEVVTETYMIVEDQEVDDDDGGGDASDSSTMSPSIVRSTTPMQSPKSSHEQEEVLRELKKLWDLSEGMSDTGNDALKSSLSSIVHLAYARIYIEPDETLLKLKYLLQQLQERILLGTKLTGDESSSAKEATSLTSLSSVPSKVTTESSSLTSTSSGMMAKAESSASVKLNSRKKRYIYDRYDDDEFDAIFFANVNSGENSVIPEERDHYQLHLSQNNMSEEGQIKTNLNLKDVSNVSQTRNVSSTHKIDNINRTLLSFGTISSTAMPMHTTTPTSLVHKIIHINDRQKNMPKFYLTPERIKELKNRATSSTTTTSSTLSPISIIIQDEPENEVNSLQQQQHVDNYDIHISSSETLVPLTTATPPNSSFHKKPFTSENAKIPSPSSTTTESPFTAEDIALALFQLLRPDTFEDDESDDENVTALPHPTPSSILYQVGSLSSVLNFTIKPNNVSTSTSTTTTTKPTEIKTSKVPTVPTTSTKAPAKLNATLPFLKLKEKYAIKTKNNATTLVPPSALLDLGFTTTTGSSASTSTERQNNDVYDYTDVIDQKPSEGQTSVTTIVQDTTQGVQQMVNTLVNGLSVGAKMVLLFSVSISILSIGFGIYALQPPLAGVGVLGVVIPIFLILLFETNGSTGKRKLSMREQQEQLLISKLQSEEFSKILDMIFDAVIKYNKG